MLIKILIGLAGVVLAFLGFVATRPSEFRVARMITVNAPPAAVFAQVNDLRAFNVWNPWAKIDPAMKHGYEGAPAGPGAAYWWAGNNEVGEGRMTLTDTRSNELVKMTLDFAKPFRATSYAQFTFKPAGDHTVVTWSMTGDVNFIARIVHLFMDMDRMIGGNFEKGLAQMKTVVEGSRAGR